jgi:serine-type D-Ala-D-Ala carboxypeptidase
VTRPGTTATDRLPHEIRGRLGTLLSAAVPQVAPFVALAVRVDGELAYEACAGRPDPDAAEVAPDPGARFDLASLSKLFTATAILDLAAEARVGLDDPVVTVIPELGAAGRRPVGEAQEPLTRRMIPVPPERRGLEADPGAVTFRQLLTHTSGLAPWRAVFEACGPVPPPPGEPDPVTPEERHRAGMAAVVGYPFADVPGRAIHYSDLGFMLLGEAVRRLRSAPLDLVVRERIVAPLGLASVGYAPVREGVPRDLVVPTSVDELWRRRRCQGEVEDENCAGLGGVAGHAGLFGTARDVASFGQAWLERDPRLGIDTPLWNDALREQARGPDERRGLGWLLHPGDGPGAWLGQLGPRSYGHTGFTGTSVAVDPDRSLVVALLTNRVYEARTHEGIDTLRAAVHGALSALPARRSGHLRP